MTAALQQATRVRLDARWIALILFAITIVTRLPFQSQYLYHWDSVNMAFGMQEFNVLEGSPHIPGYIVYIAIAQAINRAVNDPQTTMVLISIVSSGLAAVAIFYLGRAVFNDITGLLAALFLMTSPLVWFYGEIALPHALDLLCVIVSAYLLYRIMEGETRLMPLAAVFLALVAGFRQQNLLFLGPLILFAIYQAGLRQIIAFMAIAAVVCLAWFIPLMQYSGGLQSYMNAYNNFSNMFMRSTSVLQGAGVNGIVKNVSRVIPYTAYGLGLAALPLLYWVGQIARSARSAALRSRKFWFLALWALPTLVFYVFIHMGQQGLVFVYLPILFLLSAEGLYRLLRTRPAALAGVSSVIALTSALVFVLGPTYPLGSDQFKLLTYDTLRENDHWLATRINTVRVNFDPHNTLIMTTDWRHNQYYLPEFPRLRMSVSERGLENLDNPLTDSSRTQQLRAEDLGIEPGVDWRVVIIDENLQPFSSEPLLTVSAPDGTPFKYLSLKADEALQVERTQYGIEAAD